jgi:hypothetical protein
MRGTLDARPEYDTHCSLDSNTRDFYYGKPNKAKFQKG